MTGFHLYNPVSKKRQSDDLIEEISKRLNNNTTRYYTCNYKREKDFYKMKDVLVERLVYISTGSEVEV